MAILALMLAVVALSWFYARPPAPQAEAALAQFSSSRAMEHVRQIAKAPHPLGTPENAAVRAYLVAQLEALGLAPQIQTGFGVAPKVGAAGVVHNVVVRLPGRSSAPALLLAAHYDSAPGSYGAADDGASVAAILETLRALRAGGKPLERDLICLFSDGEEVGLLGAALFVTQHPWSKQVAAALNFEYRGNRGAVQMFETSERNGALLRGLAATAPQASGNSLLYEVYKRMPNGTDLSVFKNAGIPGMNFAAIEGHTSYHTGLDRAELLDVATLQQQGELMLGLTRHFGNANEPPLQDGDVVYFNMPGLGLVTYPTWLALPLLALGCLLFGATVLLGVKQGGLRGARVLGAGLAFVPVLALIAGACQLLWAGVLLLHPEYRLLLQGDTYNGHWYLLTFVCAAVGLFLFLQARLERWLTALELGAGAAGCWLILLAACSVGAPGASFMLTWPLLPVLLSLLVHGLLQRRGGAPGTRALVLLVGVVPGIALLVPLIALIYVALTPALVFVPIALLGLLLGIAAPLLSPLRARLRLLPVTALGLVVCLTGASLSARFDQDHPQPDSLFYVWDADVNKGLLLSSDKELDRWTASYFPGAQQRHSLPEYFGDTQLFWASPVAGPALQGPLVTILEDRVQGAERVLLLAVRSQRKAPKLSVAVENARVLRSRVQDQPLLTRADAHWRLNVFGLADQALRLEIHLELGKPFQLRVSDSSYGLAGTAVGVRPAGFIAQPFRASDTMQAVRRLSFQ